MSERSERFSQKTWDPDYECTLEDRLHVKVREYDPMVLLSHEKIFFLGRV